MNERPNSELQPAKPNQRSSSKASSKTNRSQTPQYQLQYWMTLGFAILSCVISLVFWLIPMLDQSTTKWIVGTSGKLALMLGLLWLCWPVVVWIRNTKGGAAITTIGVGSLFIIAIRPKAALLVVPLAVVSCVVLLSLGKVAQFFGANRN